MNIIRTANAKWWWAISVRKDEYVSCFNEDENVNIAWPALICELKMWLSLSFGVEYNDQWKLKIGNNDSDDCLSLDAGIATCTKCPHHMMQNEPRSAMMWWQYITYGEGGYRLDNELIGVLCEGGLWLSRWKILLIIQM